MGKAKLGIRVAERLRRKRKITITTSASASSRVNSTSSTDWRMVTERSNSTSIETPAGTSARNVGSSFFTASTTWIVLVPGWR